LDFHKHPLFFAVVAILVAIAFLAWFAPELGFLTR
jgi:hypothetical protein